MDALVTVPPQTEVHNAYPCVLAYRSTRALVLTATGRPDEALAVLEYSHYETAERIPRGHRETARAFALHALGRPDESQRSAAEAVRLNAEAVGLLKVLGVRVPAPFDTASDGSCAHCSIPADAGTLTANDPTPRR